MGSCGATTCVSGRPTIRYVTATVALEWVGRPATKFMGRNEDVKLGSLASDSRARKMLNESDVSLALTGERTRKAALPTQPRVPDPIQ
jgi:hypothetical protein